MSRPRLSWACGPEVHDGWHHSDLVEWPGMRRQGRDHIGPIQSGLPWPDGVFSYVVSHHALLMLPEVDLVPALAELLRVTGTGGFLRLSVPDVDAAIQAFRSGRREWFPLEAGDVDEAFCRYITQNGATRSLFTRQRLARLLYLAGWGRTYDGVSFRHTASPWSEITDLDSRPDESIFMEAVKL